ncbi:hypothetical protein LOTGIDRAFT_167314 [Lottia gigantea]|uniref:Uncharacterized protein n=1 Tax=Lottia gigantea TaxID=225164 RepID=V4BB86_LOTGI|nr:hypothetical protein LOTGIDRAFT_167314 [Lottia gigantea]ESO86269.1 hypothetical protein LOTGIDRAFT_167314 [Lottia gigantea]
MPSMVRFFGELAATSTGGGPPSTASLAHRRRSLRRSSSVTGEHLEQIAPEAFATVRPSAHDTDECSEGAHIMVNHKMEFFFCQSRCHSKIITFKSHKLSRYKVIEMRKDTWIALSHLASI